MFSLSPDSARNSCPFFIIIIFLNYNQGALAIQLFEWPFTF